LILDSNPSLYSNFQDAMKSVAGNSFSIGREANTLPLNLWWTPLALSSPAIKLAVHGR